MSSPERNQLAKELHKQVPRIFERRSVQTSHVNELWAADLADVSNISRENKGTKFLLVIVDVYSRFAIVFPMKNKSAPSVTSAFRGLPIQPESLWVDQGKEFYNKSMKEYCREHSVNMYSTYSGNKSVFAERFIRTLRDQLFRLATVTNSNAYLKALPGIVDTYNATIHSSIKQTPHDVFTGDAEPEPPKPRARPLHPAFQVGDQVRISKVKGVFEKGGSQRWTKEVFVVHSIDTQSIPFTYNLVDKKGEEIKGMFYKEEMQLTKVPNLIR